MGQNVTSAWESLLLRCTNDLDYRARLAKALKDGPDAEIALLLAEIQAAEVEPDELAARIAALKATYLPMHALADELRSFDERMAP